MTNFIIEIHTVSVQLLEWQIMLPLATCTTVLQVWGNGCTPYLLTQLLVNLRILD